MLRTTKNWIGMKFGGKTMSELRLTIELVPAPLWYTNLRKLLPRKEWDKIRKSVYEAYGHKCGICGAEGKLECHEIWEYDDENHIQILKGFIALCPLCHRVKHFGRTSVLAAQGEITDEEYEEVVQHFMKVNRCDREAFKQHVREALEQWKQRSEHRWEVNFGPYQSLVEEIKGK
jgi:hypothetical protein